MERFARSGRSADDADMSDPFEKARATMKAAARNTEKPKAVEVDKGDSLSEERAAHGAAQLGFTLAPIAKGHQSRKLISDRFAAETGAEDIEQPELMLSDLYIGKVFWKLDNSFSDVKSHSWVFVSRAITMMIENIKPIPYRAEVVKASVGKQPVILIRYDFQRRKWLEAKTGVKPAP